MSRYIIRIRIPIGSYKQNYCIGECKVYGCNENYDGEEVIFVNNAEKHGKALNAYLSGGGRITKAQIAKSFDIPISTLRSWVKKEGWDDILSALTYPDEGGNKSISSVSDLLPEATAEIIKVIQDSSGEEILWQNILLQYAAIIRAQQLMDVENKNILRMEKREVDEANITAKEWENHTPWERYKIFLETQSKAMNSLTSMLKKFEEYKRNGLVNEELCAKIALIRHKAEELSDNDGVINVICNVPEKTGAE